MNASLLMMVGIDMLMDKSAKHYICCIEKYALRQTRPKNKKIVERKRKTKWGKILMFTI
jgi:hypothetical protein